MEASRHQHRLQIVVNCEKRCLRNRARGSGGSDFKLANAKSRSLRPPEALRASISVDFRGFASLTALALLRSRTGRRASALELEPS